jgi:Mrp family chromosome partitioning ATPase
VEQLHQEHLRFSVKSESRVSRVYPLQKPMIVTGLFNSGKFMTLVLLLVIATLLVPVIAGLFHLFRGTIYSKHQIIKRSDARFVGVFPNVPSLDKDALSAFCLSNEPVFRLSLETAHTMQRINSTDGKVVALVSASPGNGTSVSTFGLSKGLTRLRHSVLVIDCDYLSNPDPVVTRQSGVTRFFNDNPATEDSILDMDGLIKKLEQNTNSSSANQKGITFVKMLKGTVEQKVYVEVLKDKFSSQLEKLKKYYDFIILDGPALSITEGLMLIEQAHGILLCCPEGYMSESEFTHALAIVNQHRKPDSQVLTVLSNSKIPENISLEDNYTVATNFRAAS